MMAENKAGIIKRVKRNRITRNWKKFPMKECENTTNKSAVS
jgi:hypothetical protein